MKEPGLYIDVASKTVILMGEEVIRNVMTFIPIETMADMAKLAALIVDSVGHHYNARLDGVTDDEWSIGVSSIEDREVIAEYIPAGSEFADCWTTPNPEEKKWLH